MKIAVVAPSPAPYIIGGAEKLWWGLVGHLNSATAHQADLIKLPSPEADFWSLIEGYERFSALDLSAFDVVISGKYPAWMVEHPHHVCYMLHRLRGLYDSYPGAPELQAEWLDHSEVHRLRAHLRRTAGIRSGLRDCFGLLRDARRQMGADHPAFAFPGPFSREIVHYLDGIGLARANIARFAAISKTVAARADYFPDGADVVVAYPPMGIATFPSDRFEHFFTISRLDRPKRIDVVVEAMRHVRANVPLLIAGSGPDEERLRELAGGDARIQFLGYRGDTEIADLYARALAVPFVPYAEDYGLVTVEAMMAAKPVITSPDAGGPCEFVTHEQSGLVVEATAAAVGTAMQRLADEPALAKSLGERGREVAQRIDWSSVERLLLPAQSVPACSPTLYRPKIVIVSTFPIDPPRHGGQSRIFNLYRHLADAFDSVVISVAYPHQESADTLIAPGVREIRIAVSKAHHVAEKEIEARVGVPVTDVAMQDLYPLTPEIAQTIERESTGAVAAIASHPYLFTALRDHARCPIWYEAHNFEYALKQGAFKKSEVGRMYSERVHALEAECCARSEVILLGSSEDGKALIDAYGVDPAKFIAVPNGTDCRLLRYTGTEDRLRLKDRIGLGSTPIALFVGSGHWPNIEAVQQIFDFANQLPDVAFAVVGSVCYAFDPDMKPQNVAFFGEVDEVTRDLMLECANIALNPMQHGSGTNLKMLDYFAAGIPVISTEVGARGIGARNGEHMLLREISEFVATITDLLAQAPERTDAMTRAARALTEEQFDWRRIAASAVAAIAKRYPELQLKH